MELEAHTRRPHTEPVECGLNPFFSPSRKRIFWSSQSPFFQAKPSYLQIVEIDLSLPFTRPGTNGVIFQPFLVGIRLDQDQPRPVSNTFSSGKQRATQNRISMLSKSMHYLNIHAFELNHGYTGVGSQKCSHTFFLGKRPPLSATVCLRSVAGHVNFYFLVKGYAPRIDWVRFPRLKSVRE